MPRKARQKSVTGIYHIILRGINQQAIFEDKEDFSRYISLLSFYKMRCGFALYGYCLMDNHIHLLIKEAANNSVMKIKGKYVEVGPGESLESIFKRIGVSYVLYFNRKYKRTGHLFQDRFRSEPVDTDAYFLIALRYIHQNPVKAGICKQVSDYPYSSYCDYLRDTTDHITDISFAFSIIEQESLIQYTAEETQDVFPDIVPSEFPKTDSEARVLLSNLTGCRSTSDFQKLDRPAKENAFRQLKQAGINLSQISRITGISRQTIYRVLKK